MTKELIKKLLKLEVENMGKERDREYSERKFWVYLDIGDGNWFRLTSEMLEKASEDDGYLIWFDYQEGAQNALKLESIINVHIEHF